MKIIQVSTFAYPVTGGVETQVREISSRLADLGHDIAIYASDSDRNGHRIKQEQTTLPENPRVSITRFKTYFSISQFYKITKGLFSALKNSEADVFHIHGFRKYEVYVAMLAARLNSRRPKVVVTTHNPFTANKRSSILSFFVALHDITLGFLFSRYIDRVIALLPSEIPILCNKFRIPKEKIFVIPNGIADIFYEKHEYPDKQKFLEEIIPSSKRQILNKQWSSIVLSASRLHEVKGLQNLLSAVKKLPDTLFLFVGGDDGYEVKLRELYKSAENVIITGKYVSFNQMPQLYTVADVFVLPSLHEPFGLTPVEAVAAGIPVVATTNGGPILVLKDTYATFVQPENKEGWAVAIKELLSETNEREKRIELGKQDVSKYGWEFVLPAILKVYH
ncbi:glycosyltransferase family 4 protein [Candidatus Dojkabacteria bacterium]|uniref:Glycosyltransferase family 4 protein n=1 Tax=Candidatus Dojkabacteria bacterium TaxID=2099670 RepID=A0A955L7T8_9BACT|nr:glycosyltransferase family 4 protein [Candidatus Dojkabacteria bacterium]